MKVNVIAEKFIGTANGVYTAFVEAVEGLKKVPDLHLTINKITPDADVIHFHSIGWKYIISSLKYKNKMVVSAHVVPDSFIGSLILSELWRPFAKLYLRFVYNRSSMVIAVSPQVKEELEKINVKSPINVLCNSVNRDKFKQNSEIRAKLRTKLGLSDQDFVAISVGQIQPRKGIFDFIETAKNLPDIKFVWIGGRPYGRLTAEYDTMTKAVDNAPKNAIFQGIVDFTEMPGYYAMADCFFMPSLQENFAFATIEASAVKLPLVLRDNIEYPSSLFTHYLKGKTAKDFSDIINKLSKEKDFLAAWQKESDILASKYELSAYIKQLLSYYKTVAVK
ncbi:glycosyltransferase [Thermoproteota archaeon]